MIKVSKKVEYGLTALIHLDTMHADVIVTTCEISSIYDIPEQHLGKVLQKMARVGLIASIKGAHGGYRPCKSLAEISLGQLVEVLDGLEPADRVVTLGSHLVQDGQQVELVELVDEPSAAPD